MSLGGALNVSPWWTSPRPELRRFQAGTVDEARAMYAAYGQKVTVRGPGVREPFGCTIAVAQIGPLQVSRHVIADGLIVRIDRDDLYGIGVSSLGHVTVDRRTAQVTTSETCAVTTDPRSGPLVIHPHPASRMDSIVIEQWALEAHLEDLLGHPVRRGIPLPGEVDLTGGTGRSLQRVLQLFAESVDDAASIIYRPIITEPLCHAFLDALLLTVDHPYRAELRQPMTGRIGRRPVRRAVEAIHAHPEQAHTTASLARAAGVSVRTLQNAFRQQLGYSPMHYLRQVRLTHAHEDLAAGAVTTVAEVAHRWGFTHLGRFAIAYGAKYGVLPSADLRDVRRTSQD